MHIFASALRSFAHGIGYSIRLTNTHRNGASLVTNDHSHTELKAASAFHNFGHAGNLDHALFELVLRFKILLFSIFKISHLFLHSSLKLQAAFARAISECLDASNIAITTAIKNNGLDAFALRALG